MANQTDLMIAYERHQTDIVSRLVAYHNINMSDAEDALQDVMLQTLARWETCRSTLDNWVPADLPHYLFVATHNRCKDIIIRDRKRHQREELYFGNQP